MNTNEVNTAAAGASGSDEYITKIHKYGRIFTIAAIITMFFPFIGISLIYGIKIDWGLTLQGLLNCIMVFWVIGCVEFVTYTPILGPGASYLVFITGNLTNMKVPCALTALDLADAESGTDKADVVAILATGASSIVSVVVCIVGMVAISALMPVLSNPVLAPGFSNIVPAIVGCLLVMWGFKLPKVLVPMTILGVIVCEVVGFTLFNGKSSYFTLAFVILSALWGYFLFKKGKIGPAAKKK